MKFTSLSIGFLMLAANMSAQTISEEVALDRARTFFEVLQHSPRRGARRGEKIDLQRLQLLPSSEVVAKDSLLLDGSGRRQEAFYVVQPTEGGDGYVIVAGHWSSPDSTRQFFAQASVTLRLQNYD